MGSPSISSSGRSLTAVVVVVLLVSSCALTTSARAESLSRSARAVYLAPSSVLSSGSSRGGSDMSPLGPAGGGEQVATRPRTSAAGAFSNVCRCRDVRVNPEMFGISAGGYQKRSLKKINLLLKFLIWKCNHCVGTPY